MNSQVPGQLVTMLSWQPNMPGETETQRKGSSTTAVNMTARTTFSHASPRNLFESVRAFIFQTSQKAIGKRILLPITKTPPLDVNY